VTVADVPSPGEVIEAGWPVLTMLVNAETPGSGRRRLFDAATEMDRRLFGSRESASLLDS
jgi:predicted ATP-grasp superfamily ATP-dependent carboligase